MEIPFGRCETRKEKEGEVLDKGNLEAWSPWVGREEMRASETLLCPPVTVVISRQRRRVQLMRIRQQEERKEKRRKKRPPRAPSRGPRAPPRPRPPDPAYRRRPVPIKRFNGDVLSPVSTLSPSSPNREAGNVIESVQVRTGPSPGSGHCLEDLLLVHSL